MVARAELARARRPSADGRNPGDGHQAGYILRKHYAAPDRNADAANG